MVLLGSLYIRCPDLCYELDKRINNQDWDVWAGAVCHGKVFPPLCLVLYSSVYRVIFTPTVILSMGLLQYVLPCYHHLPAWSVGANDSLYNFMDNFILIVNVNTMMSFLNTLAKQYKV